MSLIELKRSVPATSFADDTSDLSAIYFCTTSAEKIVRGDAVVQMYVRDIAVSPLTNSYIYLSLVLFIYFLLTAGTTWTLLVPQLDLMWRLLLMNGDIQLQRW